MDDLETPIETPVPEIPPVVDEAGQAQAARETAALRTARGQTRRTPVAMTEQFPVRVTSDEEYQSLPSGSTYTDPQGIRRRKSFFVTDAASYDTIPEGEEYVDPTGQRRQKPKYDDLPFQTQTLYNMAANDRERMRILEQAYPGKVKTTPRGDLYVDEGNGTRRIARGFSRAPGAFAAAEALPVLASTAGDVLGGMAGRAGGPVGVAAGAVTGGALGGAAGQGFNDLIMHLAGVYDRTPEEEATKLAGAGVAGGVGSTLGRVLLPMAPNVARYLKDAAPSALAHFLGANRPAVNEAVRLADQGVMVPPSAWAQESPHIHNIVEVLDPAFRTQKVLEQSATQHMEQGAGSILREMGVADAGPVVKPAAAVPTEEAGNAIRARATDLAATSDRELADKIAQARATAHAETAASEVAGTDEAGLLRTAEANRRAAQQLIDDGFREIDQSVNTAMRAVDADVNSGGLWQQVADRLSALRQGIVARHRRWYTQADEIAGDARPNLGNLPEVTEQFLAGMPEGFETRYPAVVRSLRDIAEGEAPPTFGQLHNLRSDLRNQVDWHELNTGRTEGVYKFFQARLNEVLHDPNATGNLRLASQMLDATDRSYGTNMAAFNDQRLRAVVKGVESGMPADPELLYNTLVRSGRSDLTRWVAEHVGPNLWAAVRAADVRDMLNASRGFAPGTYDGAAFAREVLRRHRSDMLESVHGADSARLVRQAENINLMNGSVDVPVRPGDTMREIMDRARQSAETAQVAARASPLDTLEREIKRITADHRRNLADVRRTDPLNFLLEPTVGATESVNKILAKEDTILAAASRFGEDSAEFQMLRQIYAQRFLRETLNPGTKLPDVSARVQELMFPGVTGEQMRTLAREMEFLMGTKAARTGAGRSIMATSQVEHPTSALPLHQHLGIVGQGVFASGPIGRYLLSSYYKMITWGATHPSFLRFVQRGLEGDEAGRFSAKNMVQAMLYGKGANRGGAIGAGVGTGQASVPYESGAVDPQSLGATQAPDGHWYLPDPQRPGKYLQVNPNAQAQP